MATIFTSGGIFAFQISHWIIQGQSQSHAKVIRLTSTGLRKKSSMLSYWCTVLWAISIPPVFWWSSPHLSSCHQHLGGLHYHLGGLHQLLSGCFPQSSGSWSNHLCMWLGLTLDNPVTVLESKSPTIYGSNISGWLLCKKVGITSHCIMW